MRFSADLWERALSTFAQTLLAAVGTEWAGWVNADWKAALGTAAVAGVLSLLKGLVGKSLTGTASLVPSSQSPPPAG